MSGSVRPYGFICFISPSVGGSVPSARAPIESMMRFTHSSCTGVSGGTAPGMTAEKKFRASATTLTVSWNTRNFWMLA